jgi:hypothetical protein
MRRTTFTDQRVLKDINTTSTLLFLSCDKQRKTMSHVADPPYQAPSGPPTTVWELLSWRSDVCSSVHLPQPRIVLVFHNVSIWYRVTSTQDSKEHAYCPTVPPPWSQGPRCVRVARQGEVCQNWAEDYGWDKYSNMLLHAVLCPQVQ